MAGWTNPRDWVTDEVVTGTIMNTHVRDDLLALLHPFHNENTTITVSNTTNQTSLFTTAPVITGGSMGANGRIEVELWGIYVMNAGAMTMTVRVKFGGVTQITASVATATADPSTNAWKMNVTILNRASASSQMVYLNGNGQTPGGGDSFGRGSMLELNDITITPTVNTASDQTLDVSVQWSAASASASWSKYSSRVYVAQT
jgi:hypothetical protein